MKSWRDGRTTAQRGYGGRWQRARAAFLVRHPLCVFCQRQGRIAIAEVVDHIKPHRGDLKMFWDRNNWMALCKVCHDRDKRRIETGTVKVRIGIDGWPVEG